MNKNRVAEAEKIIHDIYGPHADVRMLEEKL